MDGPGAGRPDDELTELLWRALADGPDPVILADDGFTILYANEAVALYGWTPRDLVGRSAFDFVHPEDIERAAAAFTALESGTDLLAAGYRILRQDGSYVLLETAPSVFTGPDGRTYLSITMRPNPFLHAQTVALAEMAAGAPMRASLLPLTPPLTSRRPGVLVAADADESDPDGTFARETVGALPAALAGVFDGIQDQSEGRPWTEAIEAAASIKVGDLSRFPPATVAAAEAHDLRCAVFRAVVDPARPTPALLAVWAHDPVTIDLLELHLRDLDPMIHVALGRRADQERLVRLAMQDPLTGLANRARFFEHVSALASERTDDEPGRTAVLYVDLDDFKDVNDRYGHRAGDQVLVAMALRFQRAVRMGDLVTRLGGDEFSVVLDGYDLSVEVARATAKRLLVAAQAPVAIETAEGTVEVEVGASIGIALSRPGGPVDGDQLLHRADEALYRAKREGKGTVALAPADGVHADDGGDLGDDVNSD